MAAESISHFKDVLIELGAAGLVIPILKRLGVSTVLGFLFVGVLLGPYVLGFAARQLPYLSVFSIGEPESIAFLGELGVVFLLFLIGLELSPERLITMKRLVFGLGGLQVLLTVVVIALAAHAFGLSERESIIVGMALSLSSTAIVVQIFSEEKRLGTRAGRASFSILLMQDLAVVPILILLGLLAEPDSDSLIKSIGMAVGQAILAAALIVVIGRYALRPVLKLVAAANSPDLFMAAVLFIAIGTGALATAAGLSMALGAFIAGLMLAETEYRRAIEAIIEPFKGLLLGAFFLLVGLGLDLQLIATRPVLVFGIAIALIVGKAAVIYGLARLYGVARHAALESALLLGPCGEFAFVILGTAATTGLLVGEKHELALVTVSFTMLAIPVLSWLGKPIVTRLRPNNFDPALALPQTGPDHAVDVIIAGFGRVGSLLASMLREQERTYLALDTDPQAVAQARKDGHNVYYGDAADPGILRASGIDSAKALAVTMDNPGRADIIVRMAREENQVLKIIARARDERHAMRLYQAGVTEAVPETIESSLQLGEALLVETGVPVGLAIAAVHERRDGFRKLLGRPNRRDALDAARKRRRRKQTMKQ
ncbi:MAG: cation:proton antiporter [Proteobacteria bacterium]|nr:cation:proton antiporter [Pseudomonadota bacterium]